MAHQKKLLVLAISTALVGCGGGGGGTKPVATAPAVPSAPVNPTAPVTSTGYDVPFSTPTKIDTFNPLLTSTYNAAIVDTFSADLTNTGSDNIITAGRMSVSNNTYQNSLINIYGWSGNVFENQTTQWFANGDNAIIGTEPSVNFADFNGDSYLDMYIAPGTDSEAVDAGPGVVYINNSGTNFTRTDLDLGDTWSHGSTLADLNGDGKMDIITLDYGNDSSLAFGNGDGTFNVVRTGDWDFSGSSVVAGDFLGNGSTTMILTDTGANGSVSDTELWGYTDNGDGSVTMNKIATLPTPILDTGDYAAGWTGTGSYSHDIRSLAMDFNNDGALDVVVISRPANGGSGSWGGGSMIQFLANDGSGNFTDVSTDTIVGYDYSKQAAYNPQILDLNNDGLDDILLSGAGVGNTQVLVQTTEGKFVASYEKVMDAFQNQVKDMVSAEQYWDTNDQSTVNIIRGPDGNLYLVTLVADTSTNLNQRSLYISKVEANGVTTAPATIATIQQLWPYLSDAEANAVLAATSETWFNYNLISMDNILQPYGNLNIALDGRDGYMIPISGYIYGVDLDGKLGSVTALDDLRRHWTVDLTSTAVDSTSFWAKNFDLKTDYSTGATEMIGSSYKVDDHVVMSFDGKTNNIGIGITGIEVGAGFSVGAAFSETDTSPWLNFTGMWGEVKGSSTQELIVEHEYNGFKTRVGVMNTKTEFTPGLVTDVTDIKSAWIETGYTSTTEDSKWGIHAGVLPTAFDGSVTINMPYGIDYTGKILYNNVKADVLSETVSYARANYASNLAATNDYVVDWGISGVAAENGYRKANVELKIKF